MLSHFECITHSSSVSLDEIKLIAIANLIFDVSDLFRLVMISLKYGLIPSRYYFIDRVLFISPSLLY